MSVVKGLYTEARFHPLSSVSTTIYSSMEVLRSASHTKGITDVLLNKGGGVVTTSFYSLDLTDAHRVVGVPFVEPHVSGSVTWLLSTIEAQILTLVKDRALIDIENKGNVSTGEILQYRNNINSRLDQLVGLDYRLRYYFDAAFGFDANFFYVLCQPSRAKSRSMLVEVNEHKPMLRNLLLSRIAKDFSFSESLVRAELEKSGIADWIDSASVFRFQRSAVLSTELSEIDGDLYEWAVRTFTTGSRTLGKKVVDDVAMHVAKFGITSASSTPNYRFAAARSIELGLIESSFSGPVSASQEILDYSDLVMLESHSSYKVLGNSVVRFTLKRTRETMVEDWQALDSGLPSRGEYDQWSVALERRMAALWQLSWAARRSGELTTYTPGSALTSRYIWPVVAVMQSPVLREVGDVI